MKKVIVALFFYVVTPGLRAQDHGFPFGEFLYSELNMTEYKKDTSARALVLNEFGEAYISDGDLNLVFEYHIKIKILKQGGLEEADFSIPLRKLDGREETLGSVKSVTFNMGDGKVVQSKFDGRIYTENINEYWDMKKFTLPNVKVGSVIDVAYTIQSPFIYNFRRWEFQSSLPKLYSEYWATIPGNYNYNITLKGYLGLVKDTAEVIYDCFTPGGGRKADCARYKFAVSDIPAFVEEDYMTAAVNFVSAINFELSEIKYFDGRVDKITKTWKDAEQELRVDTKFGVQLKRGKDIIDEKVEQLIGGESDPVSKAKKIYYFIKDGYEWNETYGKYSDLGIRKAFEQRRGNVGDINLSLIAALRYAGLSVEPLILSTRENGLPIDLHPVLSDFNYVIAKLTIGDKVYLLDATDKFMPFGVLPTRCLNGKGRVLGERESYWHEIKPTDKMKSVTIVDLQLEADGFLRGTINNSYMGYEGIRKRKRIAAFNNEHDYIKQLDEGWREITIKEYELTNVDQIDKPLGERLTVEMSGFGDETIKTIFFNPFIVDRWEKNPFKSHERLYPVDFGTPLEEVLILNLTLPAAIEVVSLPEKIGQALPNNGGRYIFQAQQNGNKVTVTHSLVISKSVFSSQEYYFLKELFSHIIQAQNADLIFKRK